MLKSLVSTTGVTMIILNVSVSSWPFCIHLRLSRTEEAIWQISVSLKLYISQWRRLYWLLSQPQFCPQGGRTRVHICLSSRPFSCMLLVHMYAKTALILHLPATLQTCKWPTFITVYIPDVDVEIWFVDKIPWTMWTPDIEMGCSNPCTILRWACGIEKVISSVSGHTETHNFHQSCIHRRRNGTERDVSRVYEVYAQFPQVESSK